MLSSQWETVDVPLTDTTLLYEIEAARARYNQVTPVQLKYLRQLGLRRDLLEIASLFDNKGDIKSAELCLRAFNCALNSGLSLCTRYGVG